MEGGEGCSAHSGFLQMYLVKSLLFLGNLKISKNLRFHKVGFSNASSDRFGFTEFTNKSPKRGAEQPHAKLSRVLMFFFCKVEDILCHGDGLAAPKCQL